MKKLLFGFILLLVAQTTMAQINCSPAAALFTYSISSNNVTFTNTSTAPAGGSASLHAAYVWNFGDGSSSTAMNPIHAYSSSGTYTVMLDVQWWDSIGASSVVVCSDTESHVLTISAPNEINGFLAIDSNVTSNPFNPTFKVWLIDYNSTTMMLTAVDSVNVTGTAYDANFTFSNPAAGTYRVKAACTNCPTSGSSPVPTYGGWAGFLYWNSATTYTYSGTGSVWGYDIHLIQGTGSSGPGFVAGNVSLGANKGTKGTGVPAANISIMLRDASNNPVAFTKTDANGNYTFNSLANGTYSVYPEEINYTTTPGTITIPASSSIIDFNMGTISHTFTPMIVGVEVLASANDINVFPNPANDKLNISWNGTTRIAQLVISDMVGHTVTNKTINCGSTSIDINTLNPGVYFININGDNVNYNNKIIINH